MAWSARDHAREEEEHQLRLAAEEAELQACFDRHRRRADSELVVLDDSDEEKGEAGPSHQYCGGDDGAGCSTSAPPGGAGGDDDADGNNYSQRLYRNFYSLEFLFSSSS